MEGMFLLEMGGGGAEMGRGVGFIMGGWETFKVSLIKYLAEGF